MRRTSGIFGLCLLLTAQAAHALPRVLPGVRPVAYGVLPETDEIFRRLLADPRQAGTVARYYRLEGDNVSDVGLGAGWGLARWLPTGEWGDWVIQLNLEGMGISRFLLSGAVNEFQTIDFYANVPLEVRRGRFSTQFMLFHQSSHLGDDYIRRTNDQGFRYSIEGVRTLVSYEPHPSVRVYGGGMGLFHSIPYRQKGTIQYGFELRTPDLRWLEDHRCWFYLAQDFKNLGRVEWNLNSNTELGFRMGVPKVIRALRLHAGYFEGHSEYGQFFKNKEHYLSIGASFDF